MELRGGILQRQQILLRYSRQAQRPIPKHNGNEKITKYAQPGNQLCPSHIKVFGMIIPFVSFAFYGNPSLQYSQKP